MRASHGPSVLFPNALEAVAEAIRGAGFPPVHLAPINCEALYQQQMAQKLQEPGPAVIN